MLTSQDPEVRVGVNKMQRPHSPTSTAASEAAASGISYWVKLTGEGGTKAPQPSLQPPWDPPTRRRCSTRVSQMGRDVVSTLSEQPPLSKRDQFSMTWGIKWVGLDL